MALLTEDFGADLQRVIFTGPGWLRLATAIAERIAPQQIESIYAFQPLRRQGREWGTVVITSPAQSNGNGERRRVYHARFWVQKQGRERGRGRVEVEEVGVGPLAAVQNMIAGVQRRAGDDEPPIEIELDWWYED